MVLVIGIAGRSAAGKTYIARHLAERLTAIGLTTTIISQDLYYKHIHPDNIPTCNWDDPDTINFSAMANAVENLIAGRAVWLPHHDYVTYEQEDRHTYQAPVNVIILEGLFILHNELLRRLLNLPVYVECLPEVAAIRRYNRDLIERGYSIEAVKDRYEKHVHPAYKKFIAPSKKTTDFIIDNSSNDGGIEQSVAAIIEAVKHYEAAQLEYVSSCISKPSCM